MSRAKLHVIKLANKAGFKSRSRDQDPVKLHLKFDATENIRKSIHFKILKSQAVRGIKIDSSRQCKSFHIKHQYSK